MNEEGRAGHLARSRHARVDTGASDGTAPSKAHGNTLQAMMLWAAAVGGAALIMSLTGAGAHAEVVVIAVSLTSLGLLGARGMAGELGLRTDLARLMLGPWLGVGFAAVFGLATLVWLGGDLTRYRGSVTAGTLVPAATISGAGFLSVLVGYRLAPRALKRLGRTTDRTLRGGGGLRETSGRVWLLWTIAIGIQVIGALRGSLGYLSDPTAALSATSSLAAVEAAVAQLGLAASLLAGWRWAVERTAGAVVLTVWIAGTQVALGLLAGSKQSAFIQLVAVVVGFSCRGRLRVWPLVAVALVGFFVITPFVTDYRAQVVSSSGRLSPVEALSSIDFGELLTQSLSVTSDGTTAAATNAPSALDRYARIGDLAIIVAKTPSIISYEPATELLAGPVLGFIPRSVWPAKPVLDAGYQANISYYGAPRAVYSAVAVTPYGDLYRHGGAVVVVIGMGLLGVFLRVVDSREGHDGTADPRTLFLPMLLFAGIVKQESDYLSLSAGLVSIVLVSALGARLVSSDRTRTRQASTKHPTIERRTP